MKKLPKTHSLAVLALLGASCGATQSSTHRPPARVLVATHSQFLADSREDVVAQAAAKLHLKGKADGVVGTLNFVQHDKEVRMSGTFHKLPTGPRSIQILENKECNGNKNGGHFNPTRAKHGPPESSDRHVGDLGNIVVDEKGMATFSMTTDSLTITENGPSSVLGRTVVITMRPDDGKTQPSGNAGAIIACGVIE